MEGGKIVRTIGGENIKRAKGSITLTANGGDLTFNAKKVTMVGKDGGVKYLNNYKPPESLRVIKLEGPFNEEGEKVSVVEKGKSYKFKITRFNREVKTPIELRKTKWSIQHNEEKPMPVAQVMGKQEVTLDISETELSDKITVYAYIENIEEEGKSEANLKLKVGGIHTRFYDEQGQQVYEIPQKLHKAFNEEYGIKIGYDKENEMLYYEGDCEPAYEKVSPTAIEHWKRELDPAQTSKGKLLFGYNFGYKAYSISKDENGNTYDKEGTLIEDIYAEQPVIMGIVSGYRKEFYKKYEDGSKGYIKTTFIGNIACIDLGDFDDDLMVKGVKYDVSYLGRYELYNVKPPQLTCRYNGLARNLEHEFIGHVLLKLSDNPHDINQQEKDTFGPVPTEAKLGNIIRREISIPDRITYTEKGTMKMNERDDTAMQIGFGFLTGSMDLNPDIPKIHFFDPPAKYPPKEGIAIVPEKEMRHLVKVNYIIKLKYNGKDETFDFS